MTKTKPMKLFKSGLIYDGTGSEPFKGDILVENALRKSNEVLRFQP